MTKTTLPKRIFVFTLLVLTLVISPNALAAALSLDNIGALATEGNKYSSWWYSGNSPTLSGKGTTGATVTVTIDGEVVGTDTVDDSENWSVSTALEDGDHNVVIESGSESYAFSLSLNNGTDSTGTGSTAPASTTTVPETGFSQVLALIVGTSLLLLGYYMYHIHTATYRKENFESNIRNSLK